MVTHVALFSGGKDSLVSTHYAYRHFPIDFVAYLDTNSGLPENLDFVRSVCDENGWPLQVKKSPITLRDFAQKYGFAGPSKHSWAYRYFKERQLGQMSTEYNNVIFYSGVRSQESNRRLRNVEGKYVKSDRWVWVSPIHDFSNSECAEYIDKHNLQINPLYDTIGRSGDCYCGAYAHRHTELGELKEFHPKHYQFIMDIEKELQNCDLPEERKSWGWGGLTSTELRSLVAQNDKQQMTLCSNCNIT
jgi:3'-phosphoadenosine 5'-phosphosulfate sulfotransferase (PAPS reductase)/FAD synthetase